jgi:hypothetical protein
MKNLTRACLLVSVTVSLFAGCAAPGAGGTRTAYEKACRSPMMKGAAAREAFWCWRSVGTKSYDDWMAYEQAARTDDAPLVARGNASAVR